jgi:hypothetical protein
LAGKLSGYPCSRGNGALSLLSDYNFLVAGVVRDCAKSIRDDVMRISGALKHAHSVSWLVIESDSDDTTCAQLGRLETEIPNFRFISLGRLRQLIPLREERIAHCRNAYLQELETNPCYSSVDYVVVADLDGINDLLSESGVLSCWDRVDWGVCTANQRGPYYDIRALRHPLWSPNDCFRQREFLIHHNVKKGSASWSSVFSRMIRVAETESWIPVDSAFGGLAIYRRSILQGVRYAGLDESGGIICEHVELHSRLRAKGCKIFVNPRLINTAKTDHSRLRGFYWRLRRRIGDLL